MSVDFLDYNLASNYLKDMKKAKVFRQKRGVKSLILGSDRKKKIQQEVEEYLGYKLKM